MGGDSGRKLADVTRNIGVPPEAAPTLATDGHDIELQSVAGKIPPEYVLATFDLTGGTSIVVDVWIYNSDVINVAAWQMVASQTVTGTFALGSSFILVPSMGASRMAFIVRSQIGGVATVKYTLRAIDNDEARLITSLIGSTTDVNIMQILGMAVASPTVAGYLPVGADIRKVAGNAVAATTVSGKVPSENVSVVGANDVNLWHNAGAAKALAAGYVAGDWFTPSTYCELMVGLQLTAVGAPHLQFYFEWSPVVGGAPAYRCSVTNLISGGIEDCGDHVVRFQSVNTSNKSYKLEVFPGKYYRMSANYVDTGASTLSLLAIGYIGRP